MASQEITREGLMASLPIEILSLVVQARQDLSYLRATCSTKVTKEEAINYLQKNGNANVLMFFDHPGAKATMITNIKHHFATSGLVIDRVFLQYERNKDGNVTAEIYRPNMVESYEAVFGYNKIFLGLDLLSEYRVLSHQRKLCAEHPQLIKQHLIKRYNEEIAPPLGQGELSRQEVERVIISLFLTERLPFGSILYPALVFTHSLDKEGIILTGSTEVNYEDNVRIIRDEVMRLTGAVPHQSDELYLVY